MAWGVGSGPAALETCGSILPDALLLDTALPGTDCYELAGQVRAIPALASVVLIAMTPAGDSQPPAERALAAGCDAAVAKAVDLHELVATLLRCLGPGP
jgi:CheY-like chemotaxis protein